MSIGWRSLALVLSIAGPGFLVSCGGSPGSSEGLPTVEVEVASMAEAPIPDRAGATAIWTGTEVIYWGGSSKDKSGSDRADGAAYDPTTDSWRVISPSPLVARHHHLAVWTGSEMIVWGGIGADPGEHDTPFLDGAAYDPVADSWRPLPETPVALIGEGVPMLASDQAVMGDGMVFWPATNRVLTLDLDSGQWSQIELDTGGLDINYHSASFTWHENDLYLTARGVDRVHDRFDTVISRLDPSTGTGLGFDVVPDTGGIAYMVSTAQGPALITSDSDQLLVRFRGSGTWDEITTLDAGSFPFSNSEPQNANPVTHTDRWLVSVSPDGIDLIDRTALTQAVVPMDLEAACALGSAPVWTGQELIGWNGMGCATANDDGTETVITGGAIVTPPDD
jgi:hypothetical protein